MVVTILTSLKNVGAVATPVAGFNPKRCLLVLANRDTVDEFNFGSNVEAVTTTAGQPVEPGFAFTIEGKTKKDERYIAEAAVYAAASAGTVDIAVTEWIDE